MWDTSVFGSVPFGLVVGSVGRFVAEEHSDSSGSVLLCSRYWWMVGANEMEGCWRRGAGGGGNIYQLSVCVCVCVRVSLRHLSWLCIGVSS